MHIANANLTSSHDNHLEQNEFREERPSHFWRTELPNCIFDAKLDPYEFTLYSYIKRTAGDTGYCFQSNKQMAIHCNMCEKKVRTCLEKLCENNEILGVPLLIKKKRMKDNGSLDTCLYTIVNIWHFNTKMYSQNNSGTVPHTEGVRYDIPKGTVPHTNKEDLVKKNPIKKLDSKNGNETKIPRKKREIPHFLKIPELKDRDQQLLANQFADNLLQLALEDAKKFAADGAWIDNPAAYLTSRCQKYKEKITNSTEKAAIGYKQAK